MKIEFSRNIEYGNNILFNKGDNINFDKQINILSGTNGSGKTTLLTALRMFDKNDYNYHCKRKELKNSIKLDGEYNFYYYFSAEDDSNGIGMTDMNLYIKSGGISRSRKSQGESNLIGLSMVIDKIKKENKPNSILLLDEIDRNLDYSIQYKLFDILNMLSKYCKIIYSTHNYLMLTHFESYNLNKNQWVTYEKLLDI